MQRKCLRDSILGLAAALLFVPPAAAQGGLDSLLKGSICGPRIQVAFEDGFPDSFTIRNLSPAGWRLRNLTIDLSDSFGSVVFDTEPGAAGFKGESYFETTTKGWIRLTRALPSADRRVLRLGFADFGPKRSFVFKIDLDDLAPVSSRGRNRVTFGELWDTKIIARMEGPAGYYTSLETHFGQTGLADSGGGSCGSAKL